MADTSLDVLVNLKDNLTKPLEEMNDSFGKFKATMADVGKASTVVGGVIVGALTLATKAFMDSEVVQNRFKSVLDNVTHATSDQIDALKQQQKALMETTRFDDDAVASAQAFLGTFSLTADQIGTVTPHLLDMAEGLRKATGGTIDLESASNMLGKAIATGQILNLQRVGITIPGTTKAMQDLYIKHFELASVQKRVAMSTGLLDGNFKGLAVAAGQTTAGQMDILKNRLGDIQKTIGEKLIPIVSSLVANLTPIILKISEWMAANPALTQQIVEVAAVVGGLMLVLPPLVAGILAIASPVGLIVIAFAALIAAGVLLYQHWDVVKAWAIKIWDEVVAWFESVAARIKVILSGIAAFFTVVWDGIKTAFIFVVDIMLGLLDKFLSSFDKNWMAHFQSNLKFFEKVWDKMKELFNAFVLFLLPALGAFLGSMVEKVTAFTAPLIAAFSNVWNGVKDVTHTIFEGIKGIVIDVINWVIGKINGFIDGLNSIAQAGSKISGMSAPSIGHIPALANGGIVNKPTLALIGEAGPEAVVPLSKGGGLGGLTIIVNGDITGQDLIDRVGKELLKMVKMSTATV